MDRVQPLGLYLNRLHFKGEGLEGEIHVKVAVWADCQGIAPKPDVRNHNPERIRRQGQTEETVAIRRGALPQCGFVQDGANELLAV